MNRTCVALIVLAAAFCLANGQEPSGGHSDLLSDYLRADGPAKDKLRKQLTGLQPDQLRNAVSGLKFEEVERTGVVEFKTECPDGFERPYWVYIPENYDPDKKYPLVVCLHGSCAQMPMRWEDGAPGLFAMGYWSDNLPEKWADEVLLLGCAAGVPETSGDAVWYFKDGETNVLHMIAETKRQLNVDDDRVFLSGHSDGGNGTFGFAFRRPDTFAGFLPMNGNPTIPMLDETPIWLENLAGLNIFAFNGGMDDLYPAVRMTPLYDRANATGASIEYRVHDELTHDIRPVVAEEVAESLDKRITNWTRTLTPTAIDWTCVDTERGRRAWLSIDKIVDLGDSSVVPENVSLGGSSGIRLGIRLDPEADHPTVGSVEKDTAAGHAGMKAGDIFRKFDDREIDSIDDLVAALQAKSPGDEFSITVERDGEEVTLSGQFEEASAGSAWNSPGKSRVKATWSKGEVRLSVSNAGKVSLYVFPALLDGDDCFKLILNPGSDYEREVIMGPVKPDTEFMLEQFEHSHDRKLPWIAKVEFDIEILLADD